ncbi:replication protein A 70 kDa DNA-binding subunit [Artemisia annua]|uniref:Replication protein A 70 kDa DNA-binding subunit n=1 Tax=Artemisia annua TaxID=35608 RepID=A0A2U1MQ70_ARTAN|nr:replication protein A 70 kDa DNA-binding subunit [Artemisia annua]
MDAYYNKSEPHKQSQSYYSYLSSRQSPYANQFGLLPVINQQKYLESQSDTQQSATIQARENVIKGCTSATTQKVSLNELGGSPLSLQNQQNFYQCHTTDFGKKVCDPTYNNQPFTTTEINGCPFQKNKKQKQNSNACNSFSVEHSTICDQGSSHTQQFQCLSTPYDKWINISENGIDNNKQGFLIHEGKHVCLKCLNAESTSILSWEGTTTCTRCLNTQSLNKNVQTTKRGRKRQMPNENKNSSIEDSVNGKGKTVRSEGTNDERQAVYSTAENRPNSPHTQCTPLKHETLVSRCGSQFQNRSTSQIRNPTQRRCRQRAQNHNTSSSNTQQTTEGVSDLYIDLGDCQCVCEYCGATFWYGERLKSHTQRGRVKYGLIKTLDEHNELVQVFRTARDRCNEGNLPEFKIQLYNVAATREYQFPSSSTLGAIVFEPDRNSQTDFDMIIEYKDKQPKRINKLHSSYMSLQFPLLFVYGQPDYIGCYMRSTDKQKWGNPNRNQMVNRKIEIQNLNRTSIELTLWDDLANTFKKDEIDALEKPVLIAVSSCRVTRYRNTLQLQSTPATYYYINPKIPQLEEYLQEYRTLFNINPPLQIVRHPYEDKEQEKMRNRIPLDVLLKESPQSHIGVRFTCDGVITSINTLREWYYPSCTKCNIKAEIHEGTFDCKAHGTLESPNYKKIPPEVNSIVGKRHIFQFHFNTSSKQKPPDFVFNQILDTPGLPHQIGSTASGSNPVEKTCPTIEYPSTSTVVPYLHTEEEPLTQETQDEGTPVPETEAQFNTGTPIRPMEPEQLPEVQQLTPMHGHQPEDDTPTATPSTPHTGMQTRSRTDEANRRAIRRPLFPEESPDNKKKKS